MKRIMGIDPSYKHTGWAVLEPKEKDGFYRIAPPFLGCGQYTIEEEVIDAREDVRYKPL
jgi:Holliday junction resolvasome RuvABC endonuclease subunit